MPQDLHPRKKLKLATTTKQHSKTEKQKYDDITPSSIKWQDLVTIGIVSHETADDFFDECSRKKASLPDSPEMPDKYQFVKDGHSLLEQRCKHGSEAYSLVIFGNLMAAVADILTNTSDGASEYGIEVMPKIFVHPEDHKRDIYSDYTLVKLENSTLQVVVELKRAVAYELFSIDSSHLAQLLQEVYLSEAHEKVISVLGTATHCHVFVLKIGKKRRFNDRHLEVIEYYFIPHDKMSDMCLIPFLINLIESYFVQ